jgi:acyl carrier protein
MTIRSIIVEQIHRVAQQQNRHLSELNDDLPLLETGLDSLCFASLVASLDDELGLDPLSDEANTSFPVTLGDFFAIYEAAAEHAAA